MWFLALIPSRAWVYLGVVLAAVALMGYVYKKGGDGPRAELSALTRQYKAAADEAAAKDKLKQSASTLLVGMLDKEAKDAKANAAAGWAAYNGLRKSGSRSSPGGAESVRTTAHVCEDPGADDRLSDAVQKYRVGIRAAMDRLEQGAGLLFEQAGVQAIDLVQMNKWATEQYKLNGSQEK